MDLKDASKETRMRKVFKRKGIDGKSRKNSKMIFLQNKIEMEKNEMIQGYKNFMKFNRRGGNPFKCFNIFCKRPLIGIDHGRICTLCVEYYRKTGGIRIEMQIDSEFIPKKEISSLTNSNQKSEEFEIFKINDSKENTLDQFDLIDSNSKSFDDMIHNDITISKKKIFDQKNRFKILQNLLETES